VSKRYKVWLQVEELDDDADEYENVSQPACVGDFDSYAEADRFFKSLVTALQPNGNEDIAYELEEEPV
jgi:hypothetical protein